MKRFLAIFFITFALVVGAVGAAPTAHAADGCVTAGNSCTLPDGSTGICKTNDEGTLACSLTQAQGSPTPDPATAGTPKTYGAPPTAPEASLNGIMAWIASLFALLAGVAMVTLNYAVYFTVVTMGDYVNNLSAVGVTWQIMRDIGNIFIIFGFLAIGISIILNTERLGYGKKMLPMLLVAAVFLNFSLFISEAVIDTGNLFATQFYTQINGGKLPTSATLGSQGVSDKIMNQLGLTTIYGQVKDSKNAALYKENPMFIGFMSIILFLILAFVLFSLAFILIARFVILLFLIIIAPIGFAGLAVPKLKSTADKWWGALFEQTITAPILLLLLYIALAIITDASFLTFGDKPPEWLGLFGKDGATNIAGFATAILSFLVAMGLLLAVVILSKRMSAFGGGMATSLAGKLSFGATAYGMSALTGGTAFALRRGVVQRFNPTSRFGRGAQRLASRGLRATEGARMDVRAIPGVGSVLGDAGTPVQRSTVARAQQGTEWLRHGGDEANRQMDQETRIPRLTRSIQAGNAQQVGQALGSMSNKELESQPIVRLLTRNPLAAALLPQNRFDALMQSDAISDREKDLLRDARRNDPRFVDAAAAAVAIPAMTTDQRSQLNGNILVLPHVMELLDAPDFAAIQRAGRLNAGQRNAMSLYLQGVATAPVPPDPARQARIGALFAADPRFSSYFGP